MLVTAIAWVVHGQKLDAAGLLGIGLILIGVLVLDLFSRSVAH